MDAPHVLLNRTGTSQAVVGGQKGGVNRWQMHLGNGSVENGSNSGSDFELLSFDDAGGYLPRPLSIMRATGAVDFAVPPTVAGVPIGGGGLDQATADTLYVNIVGDTMTGPLTVNGLFYAAATPKGHQ